MVSPATPTSKLYWLLLAGGVGVFAGGVLDGGVGEAVAATSWILGLWGSVQQKYELCMAGGTFIEAACTVFSAEAIAIDEASARVQTFLRTVALR